jgi:hypothetical protein
MDWEDDYDDTFDDEYEDDYYEGRLSIGQKKSSC